MKAMISVTLLIAATLLQSDLLSQELPSKQELRDLRDKQTRTQQKAFASPRFKMKERESATQANFDVRYYYLNLFVNPQVGQLSGFVELTGMANIDDFNTVELDFYDNMLVDSVAVDAVSFTHSDKLLTLALSTAKMAGEYFTLRVYYHGQPLNSGFGSFGFDTQNGTPIIWSLSEPYFARSWWPCKDTPNDKADSVDVVVTVPDGLTVASNGTLAGVMANADGTMTFHWKERYAITTYLVSLAITNYTTYSEWFRYADTDSMEVKYYIYPQDFDTAKSQLAGTLSMLEFFHKVFGPYPFLQEKYGIAQFPWGGGMEHQTITSQSSFETVLTVHELAHQWWGDKITNQNWHEIWLNEGFASYSEALYFEKALGHQAYQAHMENMDWDFPYAIYVDDTTSVTRIFHATVYDKGAWVLHMLRHVVGDSTFFDILLHYANDSRFAYGNATTAGFQDVCETVSAVDLDWFFDSWIYQVGRPLYDVVWGSEDSAGTVFVNIDIEQSQYSENGLFPMPIDITLQMDGSDTVVTVFNDTHVQSFRFRAPHPVNSISIDKDHWILKKVLSVTPTNGPLVPGQYVLRQNYPNPFNTTTVIEFMLPKADHVEAVIFNLSGEIIRHLASDDFEAGILRIPWNGQSDRGDPVASGLYLYQLRTTEYQFSKKLLLVR